ncbi:MAG: hypothetical protein RL141_671 [Candidatus Parcubacteria bacterium]
MVGVLAHRGPDAEGVWSHGGVCFGHRRLAIIDLSDDGRQPMASTDGRFAVTYNGEIYNYVELKKELEQIGASFRTASDTEVLIEAYRAWGVECVKKFRGMFAFAIADRETASVFVARDPAGKKPFFYRTLANGTFAFASELKALVPLEPARVDMGALRLFFGLQYVPSPRTGFTGIHSLPPGWSGVVKQGTFTASAYHTWSTSAPRVILSSNDVDSEIVRLLDEAVQLRLRSDVPVAAFLSGGIDSTAIVSLAMKHLGRQMKTFTMGFSSTGMDERHEAQATADALGTEHHAFEATPKDLLAMTDVIVRQYDAPYADSSALPLMLVAAQASNHAKVVLAGDGGDELFGGYRRYVAYQRILQAGKLPGIQQWGVHLLRAIARLRNDTRIGRTAEALGATGGADGENRAYAELFCGAYMPSILASALCTPQVLAHTQDDPVAFIAAMMGTAGQPLERAMRFDVVSYLADDLNVKMDRATMAHGLEARCPFLDTKLATFALALPLNQKVIRGNTKVALRRALGKALPASVLRTGVLSRPKRGFQVPLGDWFRGPLAQAWKDRCLDPHGPLAQVVRLDTAQEIYRQHRAGADHGNRLWMLYSLALWLDGKSL